MVAQVFNPHTWEAEFQDSEATQEPEGLERRQRDIGGSA